AAGGGRGPARPRRLLEALERWLVSPLGPADRTPRGSRLHRLGPVGKPAGAARRRAAVERGCGGVGAAQGRRAHAQRRAVEARPRTRLVGDVAVAPSVPVAAVAPPVATAPIAVAAGMPAVRALVPVAPPVVAA